MYFETNVKDYLLGNKFSSGLCAKLIGNNNNLYNKSEYLINVAKDKKVIHVGFVDHLQLIKDKISKGNWLHKGLNDVATRCLGVDINIEGVEFVKNSLGYKDVISLDIVNAEVIDVISNDEWDYIILADVIEHINDPVDFLHNILIKYSPFCKYVIVTTPNAFRYDNFINNFKTLEFINTDHKYWFTPYTLAKVACEAGWNVNGIHFLEHGILSREKVIKKIVLRKFPFFRNTIAMELGV